MFRIKNIFVFGMLMISERAKRVGGTVVDPGCVSK